MMKFALIMSAALLTLTACTGEPRNRPTASPDEVSCREESRREVRRQMLADHQELDRPSISGPGLSSSMRSVMAEQERERGVAAYRECISGRIKP